MIERYTRPRMGRLWTEEAKLERWLRVEVAACEAMAELGIIPKNAARAIAKKAKADPKRVAEIEEVTRHDVAAFVQAVQEAVGPEGRFFHYGMTSSDVLDTGLALQLIDAADILIEDLESLAEAIRKKAQLYKNTPMIGRSHGVHAEPITFGLALASWYAEAQRNIRRMKGARNVMRFGKMSGVVGVYGNIEPRVEALALGKLGLEPEPVSTQVVPRDRHAEYFSTLAIIAAGVERIAVELRHLQRTEVHEAEESFGKGQKGSSAMPHKKNPISAENLSGLARIIRSNALAALENVALWHQRDISHSSVERIIAPDSTIALDYMLARLTGLIENLTVFPETMARNLDITRGLIFSETVMLALINKGLSRDEAYRLVQRNAMKVWENPGTSFREELGADPDVVKALGKSLDECFDLNHHLRHTDTIFKRVFGKPVGAKKAARPQKKRSQRRNKK